MALHLRCDRSRVKTGAKSLPERRFMPSPGVIIGRNPPIWRAATASFGPSIPGLE
jgi:hypothetical protein